MDKQLSANLLVLKNIVVVYIRIRNIEYRLYRKAEGSQDKRARKEVNTGRVRKHLHDVMLQRTDLA